MFKLIITLFMSAALSLEAVDFVLFTQPKTGTHLLAPILAELTEKSCYCPRDFMKSHAAGHSNNPDVLEFEEGGRCRNKIAYQIFETNKNQNSFLSFHTPYTPKMEDYLQKNNIIVFFVKRDPRDQIVSLLNHYMYIRFLDPTVEAMASDDERFFMKSDVDSI